MDTIEPVPADELPTPVETVYLKSQSQEERPKHEFETLEKKEMERCISQIDFAPQSNMFDEDKEAQVIQHKTIEKEDSGSLERDEKADLDFTSKARDSSCLNVEVQYSEVLKESNKNYPLRTSVYKEDDQEIVGEGVPKINIAPAIIEAAKRGNRGENQVFFSMTKCTRPTPDFIETQKHSNSGQYDENNDQCRSIVFEDLNYTSANYKRDTSMIMPSTICLDSADMERINALKEKRRQMISQTNGNDEASYIQNKKAEIIAQLENSLNNSFAANVTSQSILKGADYAAILEEHVMTPPRRYEGIKNDRERFQS